MGSDPSIQGSLEKATACLRIGKLADAEVLCQEILKAEPVHSPALCLLGNIVMQKGDVAAALQCFLKALHVNPQSAPTHRDVGVALASLNRFEEATAFLRRAITLQPRFPEAYLSLGDLYFRCARLEESVQALREALAQNPNLAAATEKLRVIARESQDLQALAASLRNIRRVDSSEALGRQTANLKLPRRELFPHLLNDLELTGAGVEIGVQKGNFSELLLRQWKGGLLYSVDPWREFRAADYSDVANVPQTQHDEFYRGTIQRLMPFQDRSVIWRMTSKDAARLIRDGALDFCYLDGDHSARGVREDLELWYPKIKPGGILGGHDYIPDGSYPVGVFGVQSAVQEFATVSRLQLFVSAEPDSQFPSWFIPKP